jgi:hypothetical protein
MAIDPPAEPEETKPNETDSVWADDGFVIPVKTGIQIS